FDRNGLDPWSAEWTATARSLEQKLRLIGGLTVDYIADSYRPGIPGVLLSDQKKSPTFARNLAVFLRDYDPPIFLDQGMIDSGFLRIASICLRADDAETIARAVASFVTQQREV